jgi:molybdopterin/thiamine biosynthesis adenylyltransferase/rhodanese-related sulfurtransferase
MPTFKDVIREVKAGIREIAVEDARPRVGQAYFLDVREADEWTQGHVEGAVHVPRGFLELRIEEKVPERDREIVVYCAGGTRSALAARSLADLGYTNVRSMAGGFGRWKELGLPSRSRAPSPRSSASATAGTCACPRSARPGQQKLLDSKVLLVGAGGLGSPAGPLPRGRRRRHHRHRRLRRGRPQQPAAPGAAHGGVRRQAQDRVGGATLTALNPDVRVVRHDVRLEAANAQELMAPYDLIVDGCDNFSTKYLVNDATVLLGKTAIYGSILRFEGQASVFGPGGPCYRCLYPEATPAEMAPSCDEAGVLGVLPASSV